MAKKNCMSCGVLVKSGLFGNSTKVDGKFLCLPCAELARLDPDKRKFVIDVKPKLASDLDIENINLPNMPFIIYSKEFALSKKKAIKKSVEGKEGVFYRDRINIDELYEIYTDGANFDLKKEIPLFFFTYGSVLLEREWFLITNCRLYFHLPRSKKVNDAIAFNSGSLALETINATEVKSSSLTLALFKGLQAELFINNQLIGSFNVYSKQTGRLINDYLSALVFRGQELMPDCCKSDESATSNIEPKTDITSKLRELSSLFKDSIITEEEFDEKKRELLQKM